MTLLEFSDQTRDLIRYYNDTFPKKKLGTLDLRPDITEEELTEHLKHALEVDEPIKWGDTRVYDEMVVNAQGDDVRF